MNGICFGFHHLTGEIYNFYPSPPLISHDKISVPRCRYFIVTASPRGKPRGSSRELLPHSTFYSVSSASGSPSWRPLQWAVQNRKAISFNAPHPLSLASLSSSPRGGAKAAAPLGFMHQRIGTGFVASLKTGCPEAARLFYLLLLLVRCSEYCLMEEILLSDSDIKAFSFSSNSWSAVLGAAF